MKIGLASAKMATYVLGAGRKRSFPHHERNPMETLTSTEQFATMADLEELMAELAAMAAKAANQNEAPVAPESEAA